MNKNAFIFPGQGSQHIGMGSDFFKLIKDSKKVFEEADDELKMNLSKLIFEGKEEDLKKTENTQPAILTASIAMLRALEAKGISCDYTAGLSLGEYSSLVQSGALRFSDALKVVRERGKYMQEAVPRGVGGMAAILLFPREKLPEVLKAAAGYGVVEVANYNSPDQIVLSGELRGLELACKKALELGAKKAVQLPVSAPFHTSMLAPAGIKLNCLLDNVKLSEPNTRVVTNVDAKVLESVQDIKAKLVKQVSSSVMWQQSVDNMIDNGVDTFIEIGPGKALSGFVKRIGKVKGAELNIMSINDIDSFNEAVEKLSRGA